MSNEQDARKERLAQALRDNLRRRKAQSRASDVPAPQSARRDPDGQADRDDPSE